MNAHRPDDDRDRCMARLWVDLNDAQMRKDRTEAWLAALRPLLWLVVALGVSLVALHACTVAAALVADPLINNPY